MQTLGGTWLGGTEQRGEWPESLLSIQACFIHHLEVEEGKLACFPHPFPTLMHHFFHN